MEKSSSPVVLRRQIVELEKKLAKTIIERDDLARDVEALCMETTANTTFSSSSVLRERIFATEKDMLRTKQELITVTAERDSLREDLQEIKESKRRMDQTFKQQTSQVEALEREVTFYRQQAAQAITDRDNARWECEQLRQSSVSADAQAREAVGRAESERTKRVDAERRAEKAEQRASSLAEAALEAEALPQLRHELESATARTVELEEQMVLLGEKLDHAQQTMAEAESNAQAVASDYEKKIADLEMEIASYKEQVNDVTRQKVEALVRLSQAEASLSRANSQMLELKKKAEALESELASATQEKVAALMRLAESNAKENSVEDGEHGRAQKTPPSSPGKPNQSFVGTYLDWRRLSGSPVKPA